MEGEREREKEKTREGGRVEEKRERECYAYLWNLLAQSNLYVDNS